MNPSVHENQESWQVSTWAHRAWFASGCATVLFSIAKSLTLTARAPTTSWKLLQLILAALAGYMAADPATGIYHWAVDNYGSLKTPIFGSQIEGFVGHHLQPWAITKRQLANNLHIAAAAVTAAVLPINIVSTDPVLLLFIGVFAGCVIFSQQFHAWAHTPKGRLPPLVVALQDARIILGRADHAAHHRPPFNSNYCIVSGWWNWVLDRSRFFVAVEVVVARLLGHQPRSWIKPSSEWSDVSAVN